MSEPIYIREIHGPPMKDYEEVWTRWLDNATAEAKLLGCQRLRMTASDDAQSALVEGWLERVVEDEGDPRWGQAPVIKTPLKKPTRDIEI